jgi:RimJ/RimL family protein N-acetyltransferase
MIAFRHETPKAPLIIMDTFPTPAKLENSIALIKPLEREHFEALLPFGLDLPLWTMQPRKMETQQDMVNYLEEALKEKADGVSIPFVIIDQRTNEVAGSTRYGNLVPAHKRLEIGWTFIGTKFQRSGLNRAVKFELLRYGFETLGLNRIELKTDSLNNQSRTAMNKIGAKEEGIFRNHMITHTGRLRHSVYLSIIKEEWPEIKSTLFSAFA